MNVGMWTEAVQFLFREYINSIFGTVRVCIPRTAVSAASRERGGAVQSLQASPHPHLHNRGSTDKQ
jgi:hypothetical protein